MDVTLRSLSLTPTTIILSVVGSIVVAPSIEIRLTAPTFAGGSGPVNIRLGDPASDETPLHAGLRVFDGTTIQQLAMVDTTDAPAEALRIKKGDKVLAVLLVDPSNSLASRVRIQTASGVKALRKYS